MPHSLRLGVAAAALTLAAALPMESPAQTIAVSAARAEADHELLGGHLGGVAARIGIPIFHTGLWLRIGAAQLSGDAARTGSTCVGLGGPCPDEPLRDDARLTERSAGLGIRLLDRRRITVDVAGEIRRAVVRVDTRGLTTGRELSARKALEGSVLAVDASWAPWSRVPLALEAGMTTGTLRRRRDETIVDGYSPFEAKFSVTRLQLGLAWRAPR